MNQSCQKIDRYIGLEDIKRAIRQHAAYINFLNIRKQKGLESDAKLNIHSVFIGNPGTGKNDHRRIYWPVVQKKWAFCQKVMCMKWTE